MCRNCGLVPSFLVNAPRRMSNSAPTACVRRRREQGSLESQVGRTSWDRGAGSGRDEVQAGCGRRDRERRKPHEAQSCRGLGREAVLHDLEVAHAHRVHRVGKGADWCG
jgi:hypothetical protein